MAASHSYDANVASERKMTASTAKTPKPQHETWLDWRPDDNPDPSTLLTREELLEKLRIDGFVVSNNDLRNWQYHGVIPYAVRQWHDGAVRALYPEWLLTVIRALRTRQAEGRKMSEIRTDLRSTFRRDGMKIRSGPIHITLPKFSVTANASVRNAEDVTAARSEDTVSIAKLTPPAELEHLLKLFARSSEQALGGTQIDRAEVRLIDSNGTPLVFRFDTRSPT
jgi:hypothetical protein